MLTIGIFFVYRNQRDIMVRAMTIGDEPRILIRYHNFAGPNTRNTASWPPSANYSLIVKGRTPAIVRSISDGLFFTERLAKASEIILKSVYPDAITEEDKTIDDYANMSIDNARLLEDEIYARKETSAHTFLS